MLPSLFKLLFSFASSRSLIKELNKLNLQHGSSSLPSSVLEETEWLGKVFPVWINKSWWVADFVAFSNAELLHIN